MNSDVKSMPGIVRSTDDYDAWLLALEPAFKHDLKRKLEVMAGEPGDFLRATFYRWSERFPDVCLEAISAPAVRAVGDVHVGNFGTWPDEEGRTRWGLNDFDEAGWMPFTNDLVRLATSALVARNDLDPDAVGSTILSGYSHRITHPKFGALDVADETALRASLRAAEPTEEAYSEKLRGKPQLKDDECTRLEDLCQWLEDKVPGGELHHRHAGRGSLGRVRVFVLKNSDAMEAKRVLRSAWSWARRGGHADPTEADDRNDDLDKLLRDRRRGPDRLTEVKVIDNHQWVLRPLSHDRVGVDFGRADKGLAARLLELMGAEVAHVHLLSHDSAPLMSYLADHEPGWLTRAAVAMKEDTKTDYEVWKNHQAKYDESA